MKHFLFFILFFSFLTSFSQNENTVTVEEVISNLLKNKPQSIDDINTVFKPFRENEKNVQFLIKKSEEVSYLQGELYGHNALGRIYRDYSLFEKSLSEHRKALELAHKTNNLLLEIKTLNSIGSVYRRQDDIRNALNYHQEALEKGIAVKNPSIEIKKGISISQNSIGNIYISLKQYKFALNEFSKSIIIQKELDHKLGLAINYQNIGKANEELGDLDEALLNYTTSLSYNNTIGSKIGKVICNNSIASVLIKQKKYTQALEKIEVALPIAIEEKDNYYLAKTYNSLGLVQIHLNELENAQKSLNKALKISEEYNVQNTIVNANKNLALLHEKKNNYKKAFQYYKTAKEEDAKTFNERNLSYVTELISDYEKERANQKIKTLEETNNKNRNIFIFGIISAIFLAGVLFSTYRHRLLQNEKKLLSLKQEALQSQMNPHFVFNALNSIKLYIINNEQKNAVHYLNKFAKLIRKILEASKVKEISLQEELETMDLYMTIENIRFNNEINYNFNVEKSLNLDSIKVPPLVLQPFLENAIWHGLSTKPGEKKIDVSISRKTKKFLEILIEDNGIGRIAAAKIKANKSINRKSIGIDLTKERLRNFDRNLANSFSLNYSDLIGKDNTINGTKVCIKIPLV